MFLVQRVATIVGEAFIPMPLTELGSSEDGFHYRPGAPNGAVSKSAPHLPPTGDSTGPGFVPALLFLRTSVLFTNKSEHNVNRRKQRKRR